MAEVTNITGHGGRREGAGRPVGPITEDSKRYSKARADTQESQAKLKALQAEKATTDYKVRKGELINQGDEEAAFAAFVDVVVNFIAPLADRLGRDCGLDGATVARIQKESDKVRAELHALLSDRFGTD
jgi:hypothetical protein